MTDVFSAEQLSKLARPLDSHFISARNGGGDKSLKYIEGHDAIDQANSIFGYGKWGYEPLYCKQEVLIDPVTGEPVGIAYKAAVRLQVADCEPITDVGSQPVAAWNVTDVVMSRRKKGEQDKPIEEWEKASARRTIAESHEQAEKGSVTDGLKRCLRAYGEQFGNGLYDKDGSSVRMATSEQLKRIEAYCKSLQREQLTGELTYEEANQELKALVEEYNSRKQKSA